MKAPKPTAAKLILVQALALSLLLVAGPAAASGNRDILWNIVSNCVDTSARDYCSKCSTPRQEINCHTCRNTTEIWAESPQFVVMRDVKSCDCPSGFVHGLAVPRTRVTGFEDPLRPDGIWKFAWEAGVKKMPEVELALAVNPKRERSQDQLHVHLVRVVREKLPADAKRVASVDSLDKVWYVAAKLAADLNWKDYGVLVTRGADGYLVVVDDHSPEDDYTIAQCKGAWTP
ncbi:CDP-diacylglycerol diphosphatase [Geomonas sp.]|uniref:CDP-diacylglycerol diphosphatase n=1 Tax=Geomonas sp. TaxID=2651584 RepID=UPI002B46AFF1|nr:CDP-diacylglycerol diphosphatase [Geomonas sp.]HJV36432.1 CDP-diacylglycerol diphosphatase [Geomonas sp.]